MSNGIQAVWVVGKYFGEAKKKVDALENNGVGYFSIGDKLNAFRMVPDPIDGIPEHLIQVVDPYKIKEYEKKRIVRTGTIQHEVKKLEEEVQKIHEIFGELKPRKDIDA
jgi:hypothetical protein